ncbi:MAG TPA: glutaredoxin family protein [Dokdonella sp.]|uniref:glutaredoxin family protein n=1 Tax=Dokdonella sp. TaxID=2291710 RepID=UPI002D7EFFCE|nr:glutaredoxin family protein [Dokdonella sp.]HET9033478.1 glutaredoxin family protein [Dokdonella sp.]
MMRRINMRGRLPGLAMLLALLSACSNQADIAEVRTMIGDAPVLMLSTSTCGYCKKLRADLSDWGVEYVDVNVETDRNGQRLFGLVNGRGVPVLLIGDEIVHGYSPTRSRKLLVAANLTNETSRP